MPICITLIKVMQMHWIILLFCNKQINLIVLFYLIYFIHIISNLIHTYVTLVKIMQMYWIFLLLCNIHVQDNIFHFIWFQNAIIGLFLSYAIPLCLGYISYHLIEYCNTLWTPWQYHIQSIHTCITFIRVIQCPKGKIQISYPTIFTSTLPSLGHYISSRSYWCFTVPLGQLILFHFIYYNNAIPWRHIRNNLC
jgi:hypothetical protein